MNRTEELTDLYFDDLEFCIFGKGSQIFLAIDQLEVNND